MRARTAGRLSIAFLFLTACREAPPPEWHDEGAYRWRELRVPRAGRAGFTQLAPPRTGLDFTNTLDPEKALRQRHLADGSGVALGDINGDGMVDVFLASIDGESALFRNLGDWRFANVTAASGISTRGRHATGAAFADVDGDGDLDLYVAMLGGPNALFVNDGAGRFSDRTREAGLFSNRGSRTPAFADVDGDGDLDLYVANYKTDNAQDLFSPQERAFDQVIRRVGDHFEVVPRFREHYRVLVLKELGAVVQIQRADPDGFYLNDGRGRFTPVPLAGGRFLDEDGRPLSAEPDYFGFAGRFYDVDSDGDPDLYVCNDFEDPDQFFLNDGTGRFRAASRLAVRNTSNACMGVDFADIDRDGDVDFFETDMLSRDSRRRKTQTPTHTPLPKLIGQIDNRPQMQRNTLQLNRGDGTFAEVASLAGVDASDWSWAALFLDVDVDGYEDILVATGHLWDVMDSDTWDRIRSRFTGHDWRRELALFPPLRLKNVAFKNNGDLTFTEMGAVWGFGPEPDLSHGIAAGDLDGDGDADVVVTRLNDPVAVFRNNATAARITVRLRGQPPNTQGIGAKIRVLGGPVPEQQKEVTAGGVYLSGSDAACVFAAGEADSLTIVVEWRGGGESVVEGARPNRLYEIREPNQPTAARTGTEKPHAPRTTHLFVDASALLGHRHVEASFDDFARQPLLPNRLSQLGPGITWYDVDGDGDEDLLIASGRGARLAYYRNDGGRFTTVDLGVGADYDQTSVLALPDSPGKTALLVGQASYEAPTADSAAALPAVLRLTPGGAATAAVRGDASSAGPLALADYDGDGDLDLFVGGRVVPGQYPAPATSRLLKNDGGLFVPDLENQPRLTGLGLVSAAVFSDIDGDGDPDLVVALEWGPIKVFTNEGGRFREARGTGLEQHTSRWNGVTTGDLDGDGWLDIVATSWGRNTKYRADSKRPLAVYYGDLDGNGTADVIEAQFDARVRAVAPVETLARLSFALPRARLRARTFAAYADATLQDVLGPELARAGRLEATTLDHTAFYNRGARFEARPLPAEAQFAPAFYVGIADFDGDGHEDLFLSQNFFPTEIGTQRYDAGRGLLLRGDGRGGLEPVPGRASGIAVYGDQRGAAFADYDADGRLDVAVSQNGAQTKLYRNAGARPGLRVRLVGPAGNPRAIGALVRVVYTDGRGPAREVQAGSGYWSQNGAVQVLGLAEGREPRAVWVRWPDGTEAEMPIAAGARDVTIRP